MPPHITRLLRASSTPELHTSTSLHLHRASRPSYLHVATPSSSLQALIPPRRYTFIEPPDLHTSLSLHRHRASRPPYLHVATPSSNLQTSIPPRRYTFIEPPYLHVATPPNLHTSTSLHRHRASRPPYIHVATPSSCLHTSTSLHRHRASRPPYHHVATPSSSLQTSIILQLHVVKSGSVRVRAVALLPHQNFPFPASKPNPQHLQHLQHTLRVSSPPVLHISTPVTSLQTSRHPSTTS